MASGSAPVAARSAGGSPALLVAALTLGFSGVAGGVPPGDEAGAVAQTFDRYRAALLAGDGAAAVELVDRETLGYFQELRALALASPEDAALEARSFVERFLVLTMRESMPRHELTELELEDLIDRAVAEGWIQRASIEGLELGPVTVTGDVATAPARGGALGGATAGEPALVYRFRRQGGSWRFAFGDLVRDLDALVAELLREAGADQDALLFTLLENLTGERLLPPGEGETGSADARGRGAELPRIVLPPGT